MTISIPKPARRSRKAPQPIRRSRTRRRKPTPRQAAVRLADRLWAFLVCANVGPGYDAHHWISRRRHSVRWDLHNGYPLARWVHDEVTHNRELNAWMAQGTLGRDAWERLRARAVQDPPERPEDAVARLRALVRLRGLTAQARERELL